MVRVAIIGAGCSGLTAIKECISAGLEVTCFEQSDEIGGLWKYEEPSPDKEVHSSVYRNTIINTSKQMMAFSDFPIPNDWPTFLHNRSILEYFKKYALHFNLAPLIKFGVKVLSVHPAVKSSTFENGANESHDGSWEITFIDSKFKDVNQTTKLVFDKVIIASGHHWKPLVPKFNGLEDFKGQVLHSHYYRDAHPYKDKRCLVVGIGNSAVDLAVELSFHAKQVQLSTRSNAWVVPRYSITGAPGDQALTRAFYYIPMFLRNFIFRLILWFQWGNIARFGFSPKHSPFSAHPTVNGELYARIGTGTIKIQKNIKKFMANSVEFDDGTISDIDCVFLCTGYEIGFPFLDAKRICGLDLKTNEIQMYKYVWPVNHKNIAFVGLIQPLGSIMPISELQCRWIAQVFSGSCNLPNKENMESDIKKLKKQMKNRYISSNRHTIQVDYGPYCDEIGSNIGVTPNLWYILVTDPWLWSKMVFGCWTPHQYRLQGVSAWKFARKEILESNSGYDYRKWMGF